MSVYTITGVTGFIGGHLLEELIKRGHRVNVLVRDASFTHDSELVNVFNFAPDELAMAIQDSDHVVHLAARYTTGQSMNDVQELIESNVLLSSLILSAISNFNPEATFVSTSTFSSYDHEGNYAPATVYSATKSAVEVMAAAFKTKQTVFLTLAETYGPGDNRPKIHNLLRNTFEAGKTFEMRSPKEQRVNLTHVYDVVSGLIYASEETFEDVGHGNVFTYDFFYPENEMSLEELAEIFLAYYGGAYTAPNVGNITVMMTQESIMPDFALVHNAKATVLQEVRKR